MDEIKDTRTDRLAMADLCRRFQVAGIDTDRAPLDLLNETWARMARRLAAIGDGDFDTVWAAIEKDVAREEERLNINSGRASAGELEAVKPLHRVRDLVGLIIEWRGETFEAEEIAAGRDPHVAADGWKAPQGWVPPQGQR